MAVTISAKKQPNIVWFLTDDQDQVGYDSRRARGRLKRRTLQTIFSRSIVTRCNSGTRCGGPGATGWRKMRARTHTHTHTHTYKSKNDIIHILFCYHQMLGSSFPNKNGSTPMPKTKALMEDMGAMANNMFIHTPICKQLRSLCLHPQHSTESPALIVSIYANTQC